MLQSLLLFSLAVALGLSRPQSFFFENWYDVPEHSQGRIQHTNYNNDYRNQRGNYYHHQDHGGHFYHHYHQHRPSNVYENKKYNHFGPIRDSNFGESSPKETRRNFGQFWHGEEFGRPWESSTKYPPGHRLHNHPPGHPWHNPNVPYEHEEEEENLPDPSIFPFGDRVTKRPIKTTPMTTPFPWSHKRPTPSIKPSLEELEKEKRPGNSWNTLEHPDQLLTSTNKPRRTTTPTGNGRPLPSGSSNGLRPSVPKEEEPCRIPVEDLKRIFRLEDLLPKDADPKEYPPEVLDKIICTIGSSLLNGTIQYIKNNEGQIGSTSSAPITTSMLPVVVDEEEESTSTGGPDWNTPGPEGPLPEVVDEVEGSTSSSGRPDQAPVPTETSGEAFPKVEESTSSGRPQTSSKPSLTDTKAPSTTMPTFTSEERLPEVVDEVEGSTLPGRPQTSPEPTPAPMPTFTSGGRLPEVEGSTSSGRPNWNVQSSPETEVFYVSKVQDEGTLFLSKFVPNTSPVVNVVPIISTSTGQKSGRPLFKINPPVIFVYHGEKGEAKIDIPIIPEDRDVFFQFADDFPEVFQKLHTKNPVLIVNHDSSVMEDQRSKDITFIQELLTKLGGQNDLPILNLENLPPNVQIVEEKSKVEELKMLLNIPVSKPRLQDGPRAKVNPLKPKNYQSTILEIVPETPKAAPSSEMVQVSKDIINVLNSGALEKIQISPEALDNPESFQKLKNEIKGTILERLKNLHGSNNTIQIQDAKITRSRLTSRSYKRRSRFRKTRSPESQVPLTSIFDVSNLLQKGETPEMYSPEVLADIQKEIGTYILEGVQDYIAKNSDRSRRRRSIGTSGRIQKRLSSSRSKRGLGDRLEKDNIAVKGHKSKYEPLQELQKDKTSEMYPPEVLEAIQKQTGTNILAGVQEIIGLSEQEANRRKRSPSFLPFGIFQKSLTPSRSTGNIYSLLTSPSRSRRSTDSFLGGNYLTFDPSQDIGSYTRGEREASGYRPEVPDHVKDLIHEIFHKPNMEDITISDCRLPISIRAGNKKCGQEFSFIPDNGNKPEVHTSGKSPYNIGMLLPGEDYNAYPKEVLEAIQMEIGAAIERGKKKHQNGGISFQNYPFGKEVSHGRVPSQQGSGIVFPNMGFGNGLVETSGNMDIRDYLRYQGHKRVPRPTLGSDKYIFSS